MSFDPDDPRLTAFALGELEEADRRAVEALLADHAEAGRVVAEIRETAALLTTALKGEPAPGLSIVQRIDLEGRLGADGPSRRRAFRRSLLAAAAGLSLALGGYGLGVRTAPRSPLGAVVEEAVGVGSIAAVGRDRADREIAAAPFPAPFAAPASAESDPLAGPMAEFGGPTEPTRGGMMGMLRQEGGPAVPTGSMLAGSGGFDSRSRTPSAPAVGAELDEAAPPLPPPIEAASGLMDEAEQADQRPPDGRDRLAGEGPPILARRAEGPDLLRDTPAGARSPATAAPEAPAAARSLPDSGASDGTSRKVAGLPDGEAAAVGVGGGVPEGRAREVRVAGEALVEVLDGPEGRPARRFALPAPVREVALDPTGSRLLATTADRAVSVFDVDRGVLVNRLRADRGPVPVARFGGRGELIVSNLAPVDGRTPGAPDLPWTPARVDPLAAIPVDPGSIAVAEVRRRIEEQGLPLGPGFPVGRLVNAPAYPYGRPGGDEAVVIDVVEGPSPWDPANRIVRIALVARTAAPGEPAEIVADEVSAEVEFNPARVAAYRPIGVEARSGSATGAGPARLVAGGASTALFEIEPAGDRRAGASQAGARRYREAVAPAGEAVEQELLTVSLSYRRPGDPARREVVRHVLDRGEAPEEAPDDLRLAAAMAWLGLVIRGSVDEVPEALEGIDRLIRSCDAGFLPEDRREALELVARLRERAAGVGPD